MLRIFLFLLGITLLSSCAKITALEGGDKDTHAPVVDSLASTPLNQTNFRPKTIQLAFDEWVKLNDVFKNVIVSPPLKKKAQDHAKEEDSCFCI